MTLALLIVSVFVNVALLVSLRVSVQNTDDALALADRAITRLENSRG